MHWSPASWRYEQSAGEAQSCGSLPGTLLPALSRPLTVSSLAQDGSCNGLQHYAALGRDSVGAASVNLVPSDVPQDVYSSVAAQVGAMAP